MCASIALLCGLGDHAVARTYEVNWPRGPSDVVELIILDWVMGVNDEGSGVSAAVSQVATVFPTPGLGEAQCAHPPVPGGPSAGLRCASGSAALCSASSRTRGPGCTGRDIDEPTLLRCHITADLAGECRGTAPDAGNDDSASLCSVRLGSARNGSRVVVSTEPGDDQIGLFAMTGVLQWLFMAHRPSGS